MMSDLYTIRDFVRWTMSELTRVGAYFGHGTDNAWDEALALILPSLYLSMEIPPHLLDARVTEVEREKLYGVIEQRTQQRIPSAYITREAWFAGLPFYVDERVLIPRSPLAEVIHEGFAPWIAPEDVTKVLDLCTGSGSLAITTALMLPEVVVDAVDIDAGALAVAAINVAKHEVTDQVHLLESDIFAQVEGLYDVIISNPPYVGEAEYKALPEEYQHEPALALTTPDNGLAVVTQIIAQAADYLAPHGILLVEVGNSEAEVCARYPDLPLTWLDFAEGGSGVFLLTAEELRQHRLGE